MEDKLENVYKETDIEILIATMNRNSLDFLEPMFSFSHFSNFSILVINQTEVENSLITNYSNVRVINSPEKGLCKSRNLAINNAIGKILVISDDDVVYQEEFVTKIINAYNKFPKAAVINFSAINSDGTFMKKYSPVAKKELNSFEIFNVSSIEMTINGEIFDTIGIQFDENFGLGGIFEMGEEAILLFDLKEKDKQLVFEPQVIVAHESLTSSNKKNIIEKYYIQGALLTRIFKRKYFPWLIIKLFFDLKQNKIYFTSIIAVLKSAIKGHRKIKSIQNGNK